MSGPAVPPGTFERDAQRDVESGDQGGKPGLCFRSTMPLAWAYTALWLCLCGIAIFLGARHRGEIALFSRGYWIFLLRPWRVLTILVAVGALVGLAPLADDPSWDRVDATFMSLLTFTTAPWVVCVLYRFWLGRASGRLAYVALCTLLFSSTWSYDLYLFLRDGAYPPTWLGNLFVGPLLYAGGGLFWSLQPRLGRVQLAFTDPRWPSLPPEDDLRRILVPAVVLMALASAAFLPYLWPALRGALWGR